jgi:type III secretory pathway lipoprotein EscJ
MAKSLLKNIFLLACLFFLAGCDSIYYSTMETFGKHKRDILVDRVENAREAQ